MKKRMLSPIIGAVAVLALLVSTQNNTHNEVFFSGDDNIALAESGNYKCMHGVNKCYVPGYGYLSLFYRVDM